jgi:hypothetical protein
MSGDQLRMEMREYSRQVKNEVERAAAYRRVSWSASWPTCVVKLSPSNRILIRELHRDMASVRYI